MMLPQTLIRHDGTQFTTMRKATIWIVTRDGIQHHCTSVNHACQCLEAIIGDIPPDHIHARHGALEEQLSKAGIQLQFPGCQRRRPFPLVAPWVH